MNWAQLNTFPKYLAFMICSVFGTGLLPKAPGTFGTLAAIPLAYYSLQRSTSEQVIFWGVLLLIGTWATQVFCRAIDQSDPQSVVIDEVLGYAVATWTLTPALPDLLLGFLLFRFFDIFKLPPVGAIDRWSKKVRHPWVRAFGVIADDLVAGLQALAVVYLLQALFILETTS